MTPIPPAKHSGSSKKKRGVMDEGDVDHDHQNIYLFLLSQEVGFDGGRLRYLGMGASAISTAILKEEREEKI